MGAHRRLLLGLLLVASSVFLLHAQDYSNEEEARQYLDRLEANLSIECNRVTNASWNYNTDLTDEHLKEQSEATVEFGTFYKNSYDELSKWKWKSFKDPELQRRFSYLSMLGTSILNDTDLEHFNNLLGDMQNTYSTAKLCPYNQTGGVCNMELEPEVTQIMAESRDFDELSYFWESWRDKTGKKVKDHFWDYVQLNNEAARQNNFSDAGEMWLDKYKADNISTDDFRTIVADLWKQVEPLYKQLYSYVRNRLRETYKPNIREFGYIPANVLGNMWAQDWSNIASLVKPFPEVADFDVTPAMQEQGWNATRMFQTAEEFFTSLGLPEMTDTFWMKSMIVKPADREVICHASAEDFCLPNGTDFRIKMCTVVNMEYLITIHHEMGHIEYFMAYTPLDYVFRDSANPGFHEAIGDTMALSVRTPKHLQKIGLLPDNTTTTSTTSPTTKTTTSIPSTTTPSTSTTTQTTSTTTATPSTTTAATSTTTQTTSTTTPTTSITPPTTSTTAPTTSTKPPTTSTTPPTTSTKPPTTLTTTPTTSTKPPITSTTVPTTPTTAPTTSNAATTTVSSNLFHAEAKEKRANQHKSPQKMKCTDIRCKQGINFLMQTALEKVAFLPFGYILDLWRWEVFAGDVTKDTMNDRWWELRKQYQGLVPPVPRGLDDFDPGAKYHVVADVPYIRYFVSFIVQFQFHKALCIKANEYDPKDLHKPLHNCDIYQSKDAGTALENFLKLGFSEPWPTALKTLTGSESLNADAILEYFKPLSDFLQEENNRLGGCIGWGDDCLPQARQFVSSYNVDGAQKCTALQRAKWDYETFITQGNSDGLNRKIIDYSEFVMTEQHQLTDKFDPGQFADSNDKQLIKEIDEIGYLGISALSADDHNKYNDDVRMMESTYSTAKLCPYDDQGCSDPTLHLNPDLNRMMKEERDMEKLKYLWSEWRDTVGKPIRDVYGEYMDLGNHAAELNGLSDLGEMWRQSYEADDLEEQMEMGMNRVSEFYAKLHSYVRHKLSIHYGDNSIDLEKPLPAHLLGDMWGQRWDNIYDLVAPYPHSDVIDVTAALRAKNMTVEDIYDHADKFMSHTGLIMMPEHAWNNSMVTRPADPKVEVMCHPSAWDFCQYVTSPEEKDVRIKICAEVNEESWREVHKQMGHAQYFLQYYAKNYLLRKPANPAFLEAVGDTIELSIMTPSHLQAAGLIVNATTDDEADLNFLMKQALAKVASVPFSYMVDRWRWDLFSGRITSDKMERKWWEYRELYQGLNPPVVRSENDFDPGAVYQVSHDIPYAKLFISNLLQFEMHKALCEAAGLYNTTNSSTPLHLCDIYGSKMAGGMLSTFMQHGSALSAQEVLRQLTGSENISVAAMLEYFSPLETYLDSYLSKNQLKHGWNSDIDRWFNSSSTEDDTVPIVVGCVLAGLVVVVLVAYLVGRSRAKRRASAKMVA